MTTLLERPTMGQTLEDDIDEEYIFYQGLHDGSAIVGKVSADCWVCAWKQGHPQWPFAGMAVNLPYEPADVNRPCRKSVNGRYLFHEHDWIVRWLVADCGPCAWRRGYPPNYHENIWSEK